MTRRKKWTTALWIAVGVTLAHFVLTFMGMFAVFAVAMGSVSWLGTILFWLFIPLSFPSSLVIGRLTPGLVELGNVPTLLIFLASSTTWGLTAALAWSWWMARRRP